MIKIALKDIRLFLTDKRALLMTFFMPIALISIFALAFGGERERQSKPIDILVSDSDGSATSAEIITALDTISTIEVKRIPIDSGEMLVKRGKESLVLVLQKGFGDSLLQNGSPQLQIRFDQSQGPEVAIMQQALYGNLMAVIGRYRAKNLETMPDSLKMAIAKMKAMAARSQVKIEMVALLEEKQNSPGLIQAVAGTSVMMLLFGVAAMGAGLLEEKESGTLKRLLYSPMNPINILFGKFIASIFMSLLQLTVLFVYAWMVFGLELSKNIPALITMLLATSFACAGFGLFLASIAKSRPQLQAMSTIVVLSMSAIGGSMIPSFLMPAFMQKLSVISVNYWSIQGFYDIYWRNLAFTNTDFLMKPAILILIGIIMMTIGAIFFRKNVLKMN
jgi:ABC-2 type transport system permease protein